MKECAASIGAECAALALAGQVASARSAATRSLCVECAAAPQLRQHRNWANTAAADLAANSGRSSGRKCGRGRFSGQPCFGNSGSTNLGCISRRRTRGFRSKWCSCSRGREASCEKLERVWGRMDGPWRLNCLCRNGGPSAATSPASAAISPAETGAASASFDSSRGGYASHSVCDSAPKPKRKSQPRSSALQTKP